ncbi:YegP family protein [Arthrobacter sp. 31Y]|uniref:YegP family protein n=1 Tax=Arthrobacter sp. 31Y TaxID=1115632 RepID=UPI0004663A40|nr:YegP family protein [Arthrobacter sp. 31Y]
MTGIFELFTDGQANVRFRLVDSEGRELAVSCSYVDKDSAVRGISRVRECAGMGLVQDHCLPMSPADTKTADSRLL